MNANFEIKFESREQELLFRVFKMIEKSHFNDHKLLPWYIKEVHFQRGVGSDIANYIQSKFPDYYKFRSKQHKNKRNNS